MAGYPRVTHPSATKCIGDSAEASSVIHSVRLACVKHAASVHPEPGSNSHVLILVLDKQLAAIYSLIYCTFKFENFKKTFGIVLLFNCQCSVVFFAVPQRVSFTIIPPDELSVKNFFRKLLNSFEMISWVSLS